MKVAKLALKSWPYGSSLKNSALMKFKGMRVLFHYLFSRCIAFSVKAVKVISLSLAVIMPMLSALQNNAGARTKTVCGTVVYDSMQYDRVICFYIILNYVFLFILKDRFSKLRRGKGRKHDAKP